MTVSVALATYNGEKFLKLQLDSVLNSTRQPDEVVIIDDCSTDKTAEIIKKYIVEHNLDWKFSVSSSNSGYKRNFYNCLEKCTGDVIFLCDQDDLWYSEKIAEITAIFENDPQVLGVNSSFDMINADGGMLVPFGNNKRDTANHGLVKFGIHQGKIASIDLKTILQYNISPGCTCAFKSTVVKEYLKTSKCLMPHDWELNIIAASHGGLRFYNKPFIGYRQHGNNTIGLSTDDSFGPLKMRGNTDVRFNIFGIQTAQRDINLQYCDNNDFEQVKFLQKLDKFCKNREKILYKIKFLPCLENFLLYPYLRNVATIHFRGLLGDVLFALKKKFHK